MRALALEHLHSNPVGVYGDVLLDRGIEVHRIRLDLGEALPDWREYDLLVVMGGGMSVYEEDAYPWLVAEKRAIREAVTTGCPYFGVCLGSQLLASALGARQSRHRERHADRRRQHRRAHRIAELANSRGRRPRVVLRVTGFPLDKVTSPSIFTAGEWSKFGILISDIPPLLPRLERMPVKVLGFHTHIGSQITDLAAYQLALGKLLELGAMLAAAGHRFEIVNIGGGFPVSYMTQSEWDEILSCIRDGFLAAKTGDPSKIYLWGNALGGFAVGPDGMPTTDWEGARFTAQYPKERMLEAILTNDVSTNGRAMKATKALAAAGNPALVIEPGRSIVSDSGITLARVAFAKTIGGVHNLISLDLGVVNLCEPIWALSTRQWALATGLKQSDPEPFETFIAGNLCISADMLSRFKVAFPRKPLRGDVLLISSTGAYTSHFFSLPTPTPSRVPPGFCSKQTAIGPT